MKIGAPTAGIPISSHKRNAGKYAEIYRKVDKLKNDEWLPVNCQTKKRAYNFRLAVETHRTRLMEAALRGTTVYVRNKPDKESAR